MDRIAFAQHLDNAIKHLPAAQKILEQSKTWSANEEKYFVGLSHIANTILGKATSTAIEIAAAQLLLELAGYKLYDPNSSESEKYDPQELSDQEMRDFLVSRITASADRLAEITSRSISVDGLMPTDTPAGKVKAVPNKNTWDDAKLRALWEESNMPGVTQTSLAGKHGVSRQRIGILLKGAKEKFTSMRAQSGRKNSYGQLIK